jgi:hypothetical protein
VHDESTIVPSGIQLRLALSRDVVTPPTPHPRLSAAGVDHFAQMVLFILENLSDTDKRHALARAQRLLDG